jgi:predicted Ser/Thr protein kinase
MERHTWLLETLRPSAEQRPQASDGDEDPLRSLTDGLGVSLMGTLGEGGSAVVRVGVQRTLNREVAVKQPRSDRARRLLVREARIAARLQHPNILPVHDIVRDEDGTPLILMKRVEGDTWTRLMSRRSLDENLAVLLQVCNAVAFAHSRGILHRDLKPDNVMIGAFGEVVLLDWGLACRTEGLDESWIPRAAAQKYAAGTPAFMAPEMVGDPDGARERGIPLDELPEVGPLTERSDVFLLGGLLYAVLAERPPHIGLDVNSVLGSAWRCQISTPRGPDGLVAIAMRAMQRNPSHRYASAEGFRDAVQTYVARQTSVGGAELALSRDDPAGAREALHAVDAPPPGLMQRLEALEVAHAERKRQHRFMDRQQDVVVRRRLVGLIGIIFGLVPLPGFLWPQLVSYTFGQASTVGVLVFSAAGVALFWRRFSSTLANRMVAGAVVVAPLLQIALDAGCWRMGLDVYSAHALHLLLWSAILGMVAVVLHPGLLVAAAACVVLFGVAAWAPSLTYACMSAALFTMSAVVFRVWSETLTQEG